MICSANGEKFKLLVIGKASMPRAFNNVLPKDIIWKSNPKAWMTATYFMEYLQKFNYVIGQQNRKVLLLTDNASFHPEIELSNVTALNTGIIKHFELKYRQFRNRHNNLSFRTLSRETK